MSFPLTFAPLTYLDNFLPLMKSDAMSVITTADFFTKYVTIQSLLVKFKGCTLTLLLPRWLNVVQPFEIPLAGLAVTMNVLNIAHLILFLFSGLSV